MKTAVKIMSIVLIIILVANLILFGLGKINDLIFWLVILLCALSSYILTRIRNKKKD